MSDPSPAHLDPHGIALVRDLATEAAKAEVVAILTDGLGAGLPPQVPVLFNRKTQTLSSVKALLDEWRDAPSRRTGTAKANTLESFIALTKRHQDSGSALFAETTWPNPKLTAVLDYSDGASFVRFGRHRIVYAFPLTEEFKVWVGQNAKPMEQEAFAAFLEEHSAELAAPMDGEISEFERLFGEKMATPSEVVALSRHLEVFVAARAKQGVRLQTGERVVEFAEEHQNAKGESIVVPGVFMVSVPAFVDGEAVRIPARLRYRVNGGKVLWFYQLYRWEFFLREQVGIDMKRAATETDLPAFEGAPES